MNNDVDVSRYVNPLRSTTMYWTEPCPKCKAENWFYNGDPNDIVGRGCPEDGLRCWNCDHRWIDFADRGDFCFYCEQNGIREGFDPNDDWLDDPEIHYETMEEYLADDSNCCNGEGRNFVDITSQEARRALYEQLKQEFA